jgi:serine/threonine protein kinase
MPSQSESQRGHASYGDHTPRLHRSDAGPRSPVPRVGERLANGRYEVVEVLGVGGMSTVLGAFDRDIERPVALKILHDAGGAAALLDEARILAAAHSPHVVSVFALHLDASPPFLVMERVYGMSLDRVLRDSPPSYLEGMSILSRIAHALDVLHDRGITHGDVKAGNVLIDESGDVKLADLGITPLLRRAGSGDVFGTPLYMPPERARGIAVGSALLPRGDVYSFAVLAFIVLARRAPFTDASSHELIRMHAVETPPTLSSLSTLPPTLDAPLARALSKDPKERYARAGELMRELTRAARGVGADGRAVRTLVVDDDDDHRELLVQVLATELSGADVATARNGTEALSQIADDPPGVLVLDLSMPGIAGIPLVTRALALSPSMRVVVVTGHGSGPERKAAALLGVRHFLIKPVEPAELARCVLDCIAPAEGWAGAMA